MILRLILVMAESAFRVSSLQETVARMLRRVEQSPVSRSCALRPGCAPCRKLSPGCYDGSSRAQQADRAFASWVYPLQEAVARMLRRIEQSPAIRSCRQQELEMVLDLGFQYKSCGKKLGLSGSFAICYRQDAAV
ncbi:uncharacterized protein LOC26526114 isoform X2 [Drosophila erecta]|uniref:uncharacterized protein LOC113564134 isoform X2 n=1 Tax=Drosophila erecta TaxID=7220 RepID=UPI000F069C22|nr:uncharacterized protein LOC113564134 isoform X2 [Drosophila erecta]XP_026835246.1 uncharacterized protein LOC26526114 isoform X2 [Drosophila erecta]